MINPRQHPAAELQSLGKVCKAQISSYERGSTAEKKCVVMHPQADCVVCGGFAKPSSKLNCLLSPRNASLYRTLGGNAQGYCWVPSAPAPYRK